MGHLEDLQNPQYHLVKCICGWTFLFIFGPPAIWLTLAVADSFYIHCSIEDFYVASLKNTSNAYSIISSSNRSIIYFDLKLENKNTQMGAYYDNLNLTFSYVSGSPQSPIEVIRIGNYTILGFHQGVDKHTERKDFVPTRGISWEEVSKNGSNVFVRVDLAGAVRFKELFWMSKRSKLMAWADVEVDSVTGKKVNEKGITLKHMNGYKISWWAVTGGILLLLCVLLSPCWCFLLLGTIDRIINGQ